MTIHIALDSGVTAQAGATDGTWVSGAVAGAAAVRVCCHDL